MKIPNLPDPPPALSNGAKTASKAAGAVSKGVREAAQAGAASVNTAAANTAAANTVSAAADGVLGAMHSSASRLLKEGGAFSVHLGELGDEMRGPMMELSSTLERYAGAAWDRLPLDEVSRFAEDVLRTTEDSLRAGRMFVFRVASELVVPVAEALHRVFDWVEEALQKVKGLAIPAHRKAPIAMSAAMAVVSAVAAAATGLANTEAATRASMWMAEKASGVAGWAAKAGAVGAGWAREVPKLMASSIQDTTDIMHLLMDSKNQAVEAVLRMMQQMFSAQLRLQEATAQRG